MKTTVVSTIFITAVPACVAHLNMRDVYRIDPGNKKASPTKPDDTIYNAE
jgi:hypothetical protein